ncbi:Nn.00g066150.m01.CDS01 [Neocucurbitaria sp. VM-36]
MPPTPSTPVVKNAYITLLTRPSYLAGALLLAHTLHTHSPHTPLIITYTPETLPESCVRALEVEREYSGVILCVVEHLRVPSDSEEGEEGRDGEEDGGMVAERFIDTWTKLRVFDVFAGMEGGEGGEGVEGLEGLEMLCWLDADMLVRGDPGPLVFNEGNAGYLMGRSTSPHHEKGADERDGDGDTNDGNGMTEHRLLAVHTCVCNLDHDAWAPASWIPANCALTHLTSPDDIAPVRSQPETFGNFNSGAFLYRPSRELSTFVREEFKRRGARKLRAMKFPDQDFLNEAFKGRWRSLSWKVNALKTWRYWHANLWRPSSSSSSSSPSSISPSSSAPFSDGDKDVKIVHYIVDKPWASRIKPDGTAGYLGKDGLTHGWWWEEYEKWKAERLGMGEEEQVRVVGRYVAGESEDQSEDMRAIGGGAQDYARRWEGRGEGAGEGEGGGEAQDGRVERHAMLGERGHGPAVRGRGRGRGRGEGWSVMEA